MNDIKTKDDVRLMVDSFYQKVGEDDLLAPIFIGHSKVEWSKHLPKMYDFWNTILLYQGGYKGSPFAVHEALPVDSFHFERWLNLFNQTIDDNFKGENAEIAKNKAKMIGLTFQAKMNLL